jgi:hypothetical protein
MLMSVPGVRRVFPDHISSLEAVPPMNVGAVVELWGCGVRSPASDFMATLPSSKAKRYTYLDI